MKQAQPDSQRPLQPGTRVNVVGADAQAAGGGTEGTVVGQTDAARAALVALLLTSLGMGYSTYTHSRDWRLHFALMAAAARTLGIGWLRALR